MLGHVYKSRRNELGCEDTPVITVYNKMDLRPELPLPQDGQARDMVRISAATGEGLDRLLESVERLLQSFRRTMRALVPYTEGGLIGWLHGRCEILQEEHTADGVLLEAAVDEEAANRLEKYRIE